MSAIQITDPTTWKPAAELYSNRKTCDPITAKTGNRALVSYNTSQKALNQLHINDIDDAKADLLLSEHSPGVSAALLQAGGWTKSVDWSKDIPDDENDVWQFHRPWSPEYPAAWIIGDASAFTAQRFEMELAFGLPDFCKARSEVRRRLPKAVKRHDNKHHAVHARCHRPKDAEELIRAIVHWHAPWKKTVPRYRLIIQGTLVCLLRKGLRNQVSNPQNVLLNRLSQYVLPTGCFLGIGWGRWWPDQQACSNAARRIIEILYALVGGLIIASLQFGKNGHPHLHIWSTRPIPADLLARIFAVATGWRADVQGQPVPYVWQESARSPEAAIRYILRGDDGCYQPSRWGHMAAIEQTTPAVLEAPVFSDQMLPIHRSLAGIGPDDTGSVHGINLQSEQMIYTYLHDNERSIRESVSFLHFGDYGQKDRLNLVKSQNGDRVATMGSTSMVDVTSMNNLSHHHRSRGEPFWHSPCYFAAHGPVTAGVAYVADVFHRLFQSDMGTDWTPCPYFSEAVFKE